MTTETENMLHLLELNEKLKQRDKQITWLCKKLEEVERVLRPDTDNPACWHYQWREASKEYAKSELAED